MPSEKRLTDIAGRELRLTAERLEHIERRPEMTDQLGNLERTLADPDEVRVSNQDEAVQLFYRHFPRTPVTEKYLLVVANVGSNDPFVITAFFTDRVKSGRPVDIDPDSE